MAIEGGLQDIRQLKHHLTPPNVTPVPPILNESNDVAVQTSEGDVSFSAQTLGASARQLTVQSVSYTSTIILLLQMYEYYELDEALSQSSQSIDRARNEITSSNKWCYKT